MQIGNHVQDPEVPKRRPNGTIRHFPRKADADRKGGSDSGLITCLCRIGKISVQRRLHVGYRYLVHTVLGVIDTVIFLGKASRIFTDYETCRVQSQVSN
jgi:hypothetical protein